MKFSSPTRSAALLALAALVTGSLVFERPAGATLPPQPGRKTELRVRLQFVPTDTEEVLEKRGVVPAGGPPFEILPAVDGRADAHNLIGENRESPTVVPVRTVDDVAAWVTKTLADTFRGWGTSSAAGAALVLETEIVKLFVTEEHTYVAEATLRFKLRARDGGEIWSGTVGGVATRFGRSLKADNYNEVLSDALFAGYSKLWTDPGFRRAWSGKTEGGAAPAAQILEPSVALKKLLELKQAGFEDETLVGWIRKVEFTRPLTPDDLLEWKGAGISQAVIRAAME